MTAKTSEKRKMLDKMSDLMSRASLNQYTNVRLGPGAPYGPYFLAMLRVTKNEHSYNFLAHTIVAWGSPKKNKI